MKDLVCLVADKNMRAVMEGILHRHQSLGVREITFHTPVVHPRKDPGCLNEPTELLRGFRGDAAHALVVLDMAWAGAPATPEKAEAEIERRIKEGGLDGWARAVAIVPELEIWLFADSPHLTMALGWKDREPGLRDALDSNGMWPRDLTKPKDPKAAVEWALFQSRKPRSSAIYREIADRVGLAHCQDRSFRLLKEILRGWFPEKER